jgi:hypothetical protein
MRLDRETCRKAKDADPDKPLLNETPDGYHAQAYNNPGRIASGKDRFAVGKQNANQKQ